MKPDVHVRPDVPTVAGNAGSPDSPDEVEERKGGGEEGGRVVDRKLILEKNPGLRSSIPFRRREDASPMARGLNEGTVHWGLTR